MITANELMSNNFDLKMFFKERQSRLKRILSNIDTVIENYYITFRNTYKDLLPKDVYHMYVRPERGQYNTYKEHIDDFVKYVYDNISKPKLSELYDLRRRIDRDITDYQYKYWRVSSMRTYLDAVLTFDYTHKTYNIQNIRRNYNDGRDIVVAFDIFMIRYVAGKNPDINHVVYLNDDYDMKYEEIMNNFDMRMDYSFSEFNLHKPYRNAEGKQEFTNEDNYVYEYDIEKNIYVLTDRIFKKNVFNITDVFSYTI